MISAWRLASAIVLKGVGWIDAIVVENTNNHPHIQMEYVDDYLRVSKVVIHSIYIILYMLSSSTNL